MFVTTAVKVTSPLSCTTVGFAVLVTVIDDGISVSSRRGVSIGHRVIVVNRPRALTVSLTGAGICPLEVIVNEHSAVGALY